MLVLMAMVMLLVGCIDAEEAARLYRRYDEFAQQFIRDLHRGGLPAVQPRVKPESLVGPRSEAAFAAMKRTLPAGPIDSIRPIGAEIEQAWRMTIARLEYQVYGSGQAALVELWIETTPKGQFVETVRVSDAG